MGCRENSWKTLVEWGRHRDVGRHVARTSAGICQQREKQTLQVPARDQRAAYDQGAGYDVLTLQRSLNRFDPATFRKFQQSHCHDPVAVRVVALHRLVINADKSKDLPKNKTKPELESHAASKANAPKPIAKVTISLTRRALFLLRRANLIKIYMPRFHRRAFDEDSGTPW